MYDVLVLLIMSLKNIVEVGMVVFLLAFLFVVFKFEKEKIVDYHQQVKQDEELFKQIEEYRNDFS